MTKRDLSWKNIAVILIRPSSEKKNLRNKTHSKGFAFVTYISGPPRRLVFYNISTLPVYCCLVPENGY